MARFYFNVRDGSGGLQDIEGRELATLIQVEAVGLAAVRDLLSSDLKTGIIDLRPCLEVQDEAGDIVYRLPFNEALRVITS